MGETNGDFDRIVGRPLKEDENLKRNQLVDASVDQVCDGCCRRMANCLERWYKSTE